VRRILVPALAAGVLLAAGLLAVQAYRLHEYRQRLDRGDLALQDGDPARAVEALSGALAIRPDSIVAHDLRAEAYRAQRRPDEAVADLRRSLGLAPDALTPLVELGQIADDQGDFVQAADWYSRAAAKATPSDPRVLYALALARYRAGAPESAVEPLQRAIAGADVAGQARYLLGLIYRDLGRRSDAIAVLEDAVRKAPSLAPAREELADLYRAAGRFDGEMSQLRALAALDPRPERRIDVALCAARNGLDADALATLAGAGLDPEDRRMLIARGRLDLIRAERKPNRAAARLAVAEFAEARALAADGSLLAWLGRAQFLAGDHDAAERTLHEAVTASPLDIDAGNWLADAAEWRSHFADARAALETVDALEGDGAPRAERAARARRLGALSLQAKDPAAAARYLQDAIDGGRDDAPTIGLLVRADLDTGRADAARQAVDRALAKDPQNAALLKLAASIH